MTVKQFIEEICKCDEKTYHKEGEIELSNYMYKKLTDWDESALIDYIRWELLDRFGLEYDVTCKLDFIHPFWDNTVAYEWWIE